MNTLVYLMRAKAEDAEDIYQSHSTNSSTLRYLQSNVIFQEFVLFHIYSAINIQACIYTSHIMFVRVRRWGTILKLWKWIVMAIVLIVWMLKISAANTYLKKWKGKTFLL